MNSFFLLLPLGERLQTSEIRIYKAELHHLTKQKEKVDEVSEVLVERLASCVDLTLHSWQQVKASLQEAQKKVETSKVDMTRIKNELTPLEVSI